MKSYKIDGGPKRRVLVGMISNDAVLGRVSSRWDGDGLFDDRASNVIGGLCVDYFNRYGRAPGQDVVGLAKSWGEGRDGDLADDVDNFLRSIDGEYDQIAKSINPDFVIDEAGELFTRTRLQKLFDQGSSHLLQGKTKKALALWDKFQPVEMGAGSYIDPLTDDESLRRTFSRKRESLIKYPDGLGRFFGRSLEREALIAILAPEKRGKSWILQDIGMTAVEQGLRVAFFECGDLTQDQVMSRMMTRIAGRPLVAGEYRVPTNLIVEGNSPGVTFETFEVKTDLTADKMARIRAKYLEKFKAKGLWRLSVHSTSSISVGGIRSILDRWARDGWSADVVVIDYSDILAPMEGSSDTRDQINTTWKMMSRLRQDLHCLVVTATQADAASYDADLIRRSNFSEDKRKYAHATGVFAINQTDGEKEKGLYRYNWLVRREEDYSERKVCYAAGCLAIARPCMFSYYDEK